MSLIQMHILPGCIAPERKSEGAAGYDVAIRAIVSDSEMDPKNTKLRRALFDFETIPDNPIVAGHVYDLDNELIYRMEPNESVLAGIGFATAMPKDIFYWVAPRGGLASRWGITVTNAPGTVDSDYRGEAGVLILNRNETRFDLRKGMRIAQIIFQRAEFPRFDLVERHEDLSETKRGSGGFGSTGL